MVMPLTFFIPITYLVMACCLGCVALIIPTDPAFWIYQDGYKISVKDTFVTVTIPGTIAAVIGIVLLLIMNSVFPTCVSHDATVGKTLLYLRRCVSG